MENERIALLKRAFGLALCFFCMTGTTNLSYAGNHDTAAINQQTRKVSGKVTDSNGEPLLGVNVIVKGTTNGTITDLNGQFSLQVEVNAILNFSYIGYVPQSIPVTNNVVDIIMKEDLQRLDEVIVVGYGTQQKKDITGSVAVVNTKELLESTGSSAAQQLQGKAAGVYIGQSGSPGSATMVRIRGINTVNDNGPLYVIDGVSTRNQNLSTINPNDIESIQVLKDASSAAIYGAQAANGVILITTKKGSTTGQPRITYDAYIGVQNTTKEYDVLNAEDRLNLEWEAKKNNYEILGVNSYPSHVQFGTGSTPTIPNLLTQAGANGRQDIDPGTYSYPDNTMVKFSDTNWWNEVDRTALIQNHQLSVAGGTEKGQYNISANYFHQDGTMIETYYRRYQVRANTSFNLRPWLRVGENITYAFTKDNGLTSSTAESNIYSWTYRASPWIPVYDIAGNYAGSKIAGTGNWQNPVAILNRNKENYWSNNRIFGNLWAEIDLYKGLTFRTSFGLDYRNNYSYAMTKKNLEFSESMGQNSFEEQSGYNYRWVWTNTATYDKTFNDNHKIKILIGTEAIRDGLGRSMRAKRFNYLYEDNTDTWTIDMGENNDQRENASSYNGEFALFGIFGRADYSFKNKYLFTGIMRRDGVSRFSKSNRYGTFPSVSAGWRISEEAFMNNTRDWLDDLKLRFGYGETGNSELPRATNYASTFTTNPRRTDYDLSGSNTSLQSGYRLGTYGNDETKWESTNMYNVGLDATFLSGKFFIGAEWYYKKTSDMLIEASYSAMAGEAGRPYINYGDIKNTGFDFNINYRDSKGDWAWDIGMNISHYKNKILKLSEADDASIWGYGTRISGAITRTTQGHPISEFYGYQVDGFYETVEDVFNCMPLGNTITTNSEAEKFIGKFKFKDIDGDKVLTSDDRTFIGSPHPDLILGLNTNVRWKNWDLTTFWYSTLGNEIFNNTKYFTDFWLFEGNRSSRIKDLSWKTGADNSKAILPILDYGDGYSGTNSNSYYVEDGSFLRLKNLVLGYTFPNQWLKKATISSLRIYLQAENLFTITGYDGLDPELTAAETGAGNGADLRRGLDMGGWPTTRRFLFGLNFTF